MKLKLTNFRCYIEKEFDFGDEGLLLLSGHSGVGKSSVLLAINFCLYGTGTKITAFGKTSCKVEIEFENYIIIRTKKPNRLVLKNKTTNEEYEDEAAQSIVNDKFGIAFDTTSYVQQNAINSFIMMSPLEKLSFLEKFAFQGLDLTQIKCKCNSIIKSRNDELVSVSSQLNMATEYFKTLIKPLKIPFPFPCKDKDKAIKNEEIRYNNCKILIKKAEKHLEILKQEFANLKIYLIQTENKNNIISSLTNQLNEISLEKNTISYEGDENLNNYEEKLKFLLTNKQLIILKDKYTEDKAKLEVMEQTENDNIQKEIQKIKSELWKEYSLKELNSNIIEYQQAIKDSEAIEKYKQSLKKYYVNEAKLELDKKILKQSKEKLEALEFFKCPSCDATLRMYDNTLQLCEPKEIHHEGDIEELTILINKLEYSIPEEENRLKRYKETETEMKNLELQYEELPNKTELETNIEYLQNYKQVQIESEKRLKKLEENKTFSSVLNTFKNGILKQKEEIKNLESKIKYQKTDISEEDLRNKIQSQKQNKEKLNNFEKQVKLLNRDLLINTEELKRIKEQYNNNIKEVNLVETEIKDKEEELKNLKQKFEKHTENIQKIEIFKKYQEELKRYEEWENKIKVLTEEENKCRQKYSASTLMKEKILEAESIAILNVISSINIHAQEYLDLFFPTEPIVVRLLPFKETKKNTKPQINIEIDYKGMEADISTLSGGELSRVVLAYTLALAEIFNSPLILLDECTASLDQDLATVVMDGIRKNFGNKLVIIIAHQIVSGDFDNQICL